MSQNLVIPNKDNKVVFVFGGIDLTTNTNIVVTFGAETYSIQSDPQLVEVISATELSLDLSSTAELGRIFATVTFFASSSVNGTDITSRELGNVDQIVVAIGTQLIIEDGSVVADSNSFVTDDEFKQYAQLKGYQVPATQPDREALLVNAYDYINFTYENRMQGRRVDAMTQTGLMPRNNIYAYCTYIANNIIPQDFKTAQMLAAFSINDGANTNAVKDSADLASFNVQGVYSETYQSGSSAPTLAQMPAVSRTLSPYTKAAAGNGLNRENFGYIY